MLIAVLKSAIRMIMTARHIKTTGRFYTKLSIESVKRMLVLLPCICGHANEGVRSDSFVVSNILKTKYAL